MQHTFGAPRDSGFTMVELMVVVLIIGILIAVAVPLYNNSSASARRKTCFSNQRLIEGAVVEWVAGAPGNTWPGGPVDAASPLVPEYIQDPPDCPETGGYTTYSTDASGSIDGCYGSGMWATGHSHY